MKKYLEKNFKLNNENLKYDFLPPMLEIIERPANKAANFIIFIIILLIITTIIWAIVFKLDVVVTATGIMKPKADVITLQSEYSGIVSEILVEESQRVDKDTPILSIEQKGDEINLSKLRYELEVLQVQKDVYNKLYSGESIDRLDTDKYGEYKSIADALIKENELFLKQKEEHELEVDNASNRKIAQSQLDSFILEHQLTMIQNLNSLDVKIHNKETEIKAADYNMGTKTVKAPVDGVISEMQISSPGTYISNNQAIAYLIPEGAEMIFNAYVAESEIEKIDLGYKVNVKLAAYDDSEYEIIEGEISKIGEITLNIDGLGSVYPVEIKMSKIPEGGYMVGTEGRCDIIVGKRSVLDYFLEPFEKGLSESLKES